jgi:hypothetical protein
MPRRVTWFATLFLLIALCSGARGQTTPEQAMAQIAVALQTGTVNWSRFYPNVSQAIAAQTGNTGQYLVLAQLGPLQNVIRLNGVQLPLGFFYTFRVFFQAGTADFQVAADYPGNVLQLSFTVNPAPVYQPQPYPTPYPGPSAPQPQPTPTPSTPLGTPPTTVPQTTADGCQQYPQLCPSSGGTG